MEVEEGSLRKESSSKMFIKALTNPSLRDLPIVLISAWRSDWLQSPQTVTFDSFLSNFNNQDLPGGGDSVLDLDSGVFTCFTPGYYQVSFSAKMVLWGLTKTTNNFMKLPESIWDMYADPGHPGELPSMPTLV